MKIALTADWLVTFGGAEHVLAELHALYPEAPIFTTVARRGKIGPLHDADIRTSSLQRIDAIFHKHQLLLPWMPSAMESCDVRGYDVIISSSHAVGKGIIPESNTLHICYCHTPMRYAWEMEEQYLNDFRVPKFLRKKIKRELSKIRRWDLTTAKRVDVFIANSSTTQERIKRIYNRESTVILPPVEERFFSSPKPHPNPHPYFLSVSRLVPYKRVDLLIQLANELQLPLKIAGTGQDEARLKKLAGPTVEFLGFVPEDQLPSLYANATALLFPQYEDAGIVLLEAQACGTPVIAFDAGGAKDMIDDGVTGIFFKTQTVDAMREALKRFETLHFDRDMIREHTRKFSQERFRAAITEVVEGEYERFLKTGLGR